MTNILDGLTILRFGKVFRSGGGMEQYINDLDNILLKRNKVKIIRMYLGKELNIEKTTTREIGQGCLVEIPMSWSAGVMQSSSDKQNIKQSRISYLKIILRDIIVYNPFLYHVFFRNFIKRKYPRPGLFEMRNAGEKVRRLHREYSVDLLVMHHIGTVDSAEIIVEVKNLGIPYIFINHFANDYFTNVSIREQLSDAAGVAGVSNVGVPKRLQNKFCNLSDGIDTEVFNPAQAQLPDIESDTPIIFYPARILRVKGQHDLINAYATLRREGLRAKIVFAGRTDSAEYEEELRRLVSKNGLTDDVFFVGLLNQEKLRDWYGVSSILAFPTYHQEGLPRILMEAQAMKVPPVVYIIGGTPGGIQDGKTGFLVPKGDVKTFTKRLRELLINEERRKKMGEEGRLFAQKHFSIEALAARHEKFYLNVLKK